MTDTTPDYAGLSRRLGALAYHIQQTGTADGQDAQTCLEVAEAIRELLAENERLKEDRARFPDRPDDIGRMIEAHIGNLKAGKESAEALADKAFDRAFRAEAALAEKDKALKLAEFMMTKDSLCKDERLEEGLAVIRRARNAGGKDV